MSTKLTSIQLLELIAGCINEYFEAEKNEYEAEEPKDVDTSDNDKVLS